MGGKFYLFQSVGGDNVDIGCGNAFGGGGDDEGANDTSEKILDIISTFKY